VQDRLLQHSFGDVVVQWRARLSQEQRQLFQCRRRYEIALPSGVGSVLCSATAFIHSCSSSISGAVLLMKQQPVFRDRSVPCLSFGLVDLAQSLQHVPAFFGSSRPRLRSAFFMSQTVGSRTSTPGSLARSAREHHTFEWAHPALPAPLQNIARFSPACFQPVKYSAIRTPARSKHAAVKVPVRRHRVAQQLQYPHTRVIVVNTPPAPPAGLTRPVSVLGTRGGLHQPPLSGCGNGTPSCVSNRSIR